MTDRSPRAQGRCLCGGVRFEVHGPLRDVILCHCGQCRRSHGHISAYSAAAPGDLRMLDDETLAWYEASPAARRGFCNRCGASLFWRLADGTRISISAGALDPPTGLTVARQIFTADAGDYYRLDPDVPSDSGSHYRG